MHPSRLGGVVGLGTTTLTQGCDPKTCPPTVLPPWDGGSGVELQHVRVLQGCHQVYDEVQ